MNDGVHRDTATGDVSLGARTLGRVDPIVVYYGYGHCSAAKGETTRLEPCRDSRDLYDHGGYHWKKLGSEWSIYKVFGGYAIE